MPQHCRQDTHVRRSWRARDRSRRPCQDGDRSRSRSSSVCHRRRTKAVGLRPPRTSLFPRRLLPSSCLTLIHHYAPCHPPNPLHQILGRYTLPRPSKSAKQRRPNHRLWLPNRWMRMRRDRRNRPSRSGNHSDVGCLSLSCRKSSRWEVHQRLHLPQHQMLCV